MIMMEELYDALIAAHVPEDKARAAAREVAKHASGLDDLRGEVKALRTELQGEMKSLRSELQGEMKLHRWMLGMLVAGELAIVGLLFRMLAHAG